jgi:mRNA interferase MazF
MPGATFEPFDVVVVPFPFTDKSAFRRRPALVASSHAFNDRHDHLILAMITTAARSDWPSDIHIRDRRAAGLAVPCRVRLKLFTLEAKTIVRRIGALDGEDRRAAQAALAEGLAVAPAGP